MNSLARFTSTLTTVPYHYPNESERHTAQGLIRMIWGVMIAITISLILNVFVLAPANARPGTLQIGGLFLGITHLLHLLAFLMTVGSLVAIRRAIHQGNVSRASITYVVLLFGIAFLNYVPQRFDDPIIILVTLPLVAAGVLLGESGLRNTVAAVIVALLVLFILRELGVMSKLGNGKLNAAETFAYAILVLIVNGIMINVFSGHQRILLYRNQILTGDLKQLNSALAQSETELQVANAALEKRVSERTAQLLHATEEAERANHVKSAFLASMSHELRTPLNAIINFSKFLKKGIPGPLNTEQEQLLGNIADSGQHLLNLINDVLDMSKIESGSLKLYIEPNVDMTEIITTAIHYTQPMLAEKPVQTRQELPQELPRLTGDRKRLLQIFLNILANACKFTEKGHIRVQALTENGNLLVVVEDTGPGIDPNDAEAVFTAFKQTDSGLRQGGGTGLGMPICKKLVEAHEGRIWFESKLGMGTTFFVELPLQSTLEPMRSS